MRLIVDYIFESHASLVLIAVHFANLSSEVNCGADTDDDDGCVGGTAIVCIVLKLNICVKIGLLAKASSYLDFCFGTQIFKARAILLDI